MLTQENIDEINRVLPLTGSVRLTKDEIDYLNAIDTTVYQDSDIYLITQTVLLLRLRNQKCGGDALSRLHKLALSKGFELKEKKPKPKKAIIPIIGGMVGGIRPVTGDFTLELPTPIPPEVIKQPKSMTIDEEQSVSFSAEAINYNSVWWEYSSDSGSTWLDADEIPNWQTTMLGPFVTPLIADGYKFKAMFDGEGGVTASNIAVLTVKMIPPQVTLHPVLADVDEWEMVTFTAGANEYDSVKWMRSAAGVAWEDANMLPNWQTETIGPLEAVFDLDGYSFKAVFSNDAGESETTSALLTIHQIKPVIILNPESFTVTDGGMATFTAVAKGYDSVVWKVNTCGLSPCWEEAIDLPNYDTAELGPFSVDRNLDGYEYMAVFSNDVGDSMTSIAVLTVDDVLPIITEQPISLSVDEGEEVSFGSLSNNFDNVKWMKKPIAGDWIDASDLDGWDTVLLGPFSTNVPDYDGMLFKSVFENKAGVTETDQALLSVSYSPIAHFMLTVGNYNDEFFGKRTYITPELNFGAITPHYYFGRNVSNIWVGLQSASRTDEYQMNIVIDAGGGDINGFLKVSIGQLSSFIFSINSPGETAINKQFIVSPQSYEYMKSCDGTDIPLDIGLYDDKPDQDYVGMLTAESITSNSNGYDLEHGILNPEAYPPFKITEIKANKASHDISLKLEAGARPFKTMIFEYEGIVVELPWYVSTGFAGDGYYSLNSDDEGVADLLAAEFNKNYGIPKWVSFTGEPVKEPIVIKQPKPYLITETVAYQLSADAYNYTSVKWQVWPSTKKIAKGAKSIWQDAYDIPNWKTPNLGPWVPKPDEDGDRYRALFSNADGDAESSTVKVEFVADTNVDFNLTVGKAASNEQYGFRTATINPDLTYGDIEPAGYLERPVISFWTSEHARGNKGEARSTHQLQIALGVENSSIEGNLYVSIGSLPLIEKFMYGAEDRIATAQIDVGTSVFDYLKEQLGNEVPINMSLEPEKRKMPPVITEQPYDQSESDGGTAIFSVDSYNVSTYKWQESSCEPNPCWVDASYLVGWDTGLLQVPVEKIGHNYQYRCVLGNDYGETISEIAILTVNVVQRYIVPKVISSTFAGYEKGAVGGDNTYGIFNPTLFEGVDVTKLVANSSSSNYITLALSDEIESTQLTISTDGKNFRVNKVTDTGYTNTTPSDVDSLMSTFSANDGMPIDLDIYINGNTDFIITPAAISASSAGYYAFNEDGGSLKPIYIDGIAIFSILASTSGGKITVELNSEIDSKSELSIKFNGETYDGFIARPARLKDLTKASSYKYELSNQAKADKLYADFTAVIGVESPMTIEVKQTSFAYTLTVGKRDTGEQVFIGKNHSYSIGFLEPTEILDGSIEDIFMKLDSYGDYKLHLVLGSEPTGWYGYEKEITIGTLAPIILNSASSSAYITVTEFNYLDGEVGNDLPVSIKLLPVLTKDITTKGVATLEVGNVQDRDKTA